MYEMEDKSEDSAIQETAEQSQLEECSHEHSNLEENEIPTQTLHSSEEEIDKLRKALSQKDNTISLFERERNILEKEKCALKNQLQAATREKETIVIRYATKEKFLLDAKKEKENLDKQLIECKKEIKFVSSKFQILNEEKSRISSAFDEKCTELRKQQKENEKLKTDFNNLEMRLKWISIKLNQETESKNASEKKIEEIMQEKNLHTTEEKLTEQQRMEQEANMILLKHENERKEKQIEQIRKDYKTTSEKLKELQELYSREIEEKNYLAEELRKEKHEHIDVQNSLSHELLNSAKLRSQLEDLKLLQTQSVIQSEEITKLTETVETLELKLNDNTMELKQLRQKETELLSINKEMMEQNVDLQNKIFLKSSKIKGIEAENEILRKEKLEFDTKIGEISTRLEEETNHKNEERILLTKHLSEKTKLYEATKKKFDNAVGDLEAIKKKHSQVIKELTREINKYKKQIVCHEDKYSSDDTLESHSDLGVAVNQSDNETENIHSHSDTGTENQTRSNQSVTSEMEPTKQHLVDRILRLQQAAVRQTEKIDFLENHTMSLVSELQKKSKLLQYYMVRDQVGALTSSKSDQNKSELSKYGGVMAAIYGGIKGNNQSMTLDLSLEINRKLQAVLEDTLLKNITLKENLDVLGLEVDKLTRQISQKQKSHSTK